MKYLFVGLGAFIIGNMPLTSTVEPLTMLALRAILRCLTAHKITYATVNQCIAQIPANLHTSLAQLMIADKHFKKINLKNLLLTLALNAQSEGETYKFIKIATRISSLSDEQCNRFVLDLAFEEYPEVIHLNQLRESASDLVLHALKKGSMKELARLLCTHHKFFNHHLVMMIRLKNEKLAKLLILGGVSIATIIVDGNTKMATIDYARKQGCQKVVKLIEHRTALLNNPAHTIFACLIL